MNIGSERFSMDTTKYSHKLGVHITKHELRTESEKQQQQQRKTK